MYPDVPKPWFANKSMALGKWDCFDKNYPHLEIIFDFQMRVVLFCLFLYCQVNCMFQRLRMIISGLQILSFKALLNQIHLIFHDQPDNLESASIANQQFAIRIIRFICRCRLGMLCWNMLNPKWCLHKFKLKQRTK